MGWTSHHLALSSNLVSSSLNLSVLVSSSLPSSSFSSSSFVLSSLGSSRFLRLRVLSRRVLSHGVLIRRLRRPPDSLVEFTTPIIKSTVGNTHVRKFHTPQLPRSRYEPNLGVSRPVFFVPPLIVLPELAPPSFADPWYAGNRRACPFVHIRVDVLA